MKFYRILLFSCLCTLPLAGCIATGTGQKVERFTPFKPSGHGVHRSIFHNQYVVDYSYDINKSTKSVRIAGQFNCMEGTSDWDHSDVTLTAFFVSPDSTILEKKVLKSWSYKPLCTTKPFDKTFPLHANTSGIALHIRGNMAE